AFKLFIGMCLIAIASPVIAHSKLVASEPANEAELMETPQQVMLEFNREVRLVKVAVTDENDEAVALSFKPSLDKKTVFEVALPELESGAYQVKWMAMSGDSHKMKGEFGFSVIPSESENTTTSENNQMDKAVKKSLSKPCDPTVAPEKAV
ncbi:MAG: copper resistance CopC family protein, partial [Thiolinea sp.]